MKNFSIYLVENVYNDLFTFVKDEDGERDEGRVDVTEPDEDGVHRPQSVLLNLGNLKKFN